MARKTLKFTVADKNRDEGKTFVINEMPVRAGHAWATRALFGIMNGGIEIPDDMLSSGFAGLAQVGIKALGNLRPEIGVPLLNELLECVQAMPNPAAPTVLRSDWDADVEEVSTIFKLQFEVLKLHMDFSMPVAQSISE